MQRVLFETDRLIVRRATNEHADELMSIFGDPEATRHYGRGGPWSQDELAAFLASYPENDPRLISEPGIALSKTDQAIIGFGGVGYYLAPRNTADLLFILKPLYWCRGLATELAQAALATAFTHPEIDKIFATANPENVGSIRVLEKCGMRFDRYVPEHGKNLYQIRRGDTVNPIAGSR